MKASQLLKDSEKKQVEQAIADAEKETQAEIVCAIATESGRYERSMAISGLIFGIAALSILYILFTNAGFPKPGRGYHSLEWMIFSLCAGYLAGSYLASRIHPLKRLLTSEDEMGSEVRRSASYVFAIASVSNTVKRSGILLYLSLFERRIVIAADQGVEKAIGPGNLDKLRENAESHMRRKEYLSAFTDTIKLATEMLKTDFPPDPENPNELPDTLLVFHPRP